MKITFLNDSGNFKNFEEYISIIGNGLDKEKHHLRFSFKGKL